ncbi:alanine racemase [Virgisporangium ochraceum]|uniref:Alanine racemase n=1 Tax=Virgisporangium ochraceum TaxID=65505 RepID=A0A8J4A4A1_9ACTN|nr:alanine racemase [Virgisporangium ochraceum]GIJ74628.1 alanine racemase [Virgisporangium ochraceum]
MPSPALTRDRFDRATADLPGPVAIVDLEAFDANADALAALAAPAGKPLRLASKSVRCRAALERVLSRPGWEGVLAFTLPEALWLVSDGVTDDAVVGYPTVDRVALEALAADEAACAKVTIMVDHEEQLDLVDSVVPPGARPPIRVCLDLDASWKPAGLHIGVRRSPVHAATAAGDLAAAVAKREGFTLVGLMSYEAQIAGLGDRPAGQPLRAVAIRAVQRRSWAELVERRGAAVAAVRAHADLEFVNGGGTGSVAASAADPALTEVAAGSGLYGPTLFDAYRAWRPRPAAFFGLDVVRKPTPDLATVLGGGWVASGQAGPTRLPRPVLPPGLRLIGQEGAGEVQTPLVGPGARSLRVGDRVWFRHAKAGELCEHVNALHAVSGADVVDRWPTYRGEGRAFL